MNKEDRIIELLEQILKALTSPAVSYEEQHPWSLKLITEYTSGHDMDGDGLVYGEDFIFNHTDAAHPAAMRSLAKELSVGWTGKRITFMDYYKGLPDGHQKEKVLEHLKKLDAKQRS